jgi:hypothetical protein
MPRPAFSGWLATVKTLSTSVLTAGKGLQPPGEQPADRLAGHRRIEGQHRQEHRESIGGWALEIQEDRPPTADDAGPAGQIAQRFLANMVADLAGQLQSFLQKPQRVIHGSWSFGW